MIQRTKSKVKQIIFAISPTTASEIPWRSVVETIILMDFSDPEFFLVSFSGLLQPVKRRLSENDIIKRTQKRHFELSFVIMVYLFN